MSHRTRRRSNRPAATGNRKQPTGVPTVLGGALASWLVYLGLSAVLDSGWSVYAAGAVFGAAVGLVVPRVRLTVEGRR